MSGLSCHGTPSLVTVADIVKTNTVSEPLWQSSAPPTNTKGPCKNRLHDGLPLEATVQLDAQGHGVVEALWSHIHHHGELLCQIERLMYDMPQFTTIVTAAAIKATKDLPHEWSAKGSCSISGCLSTDLFAALVRSPTSLWVQAQHACQQLQLCMLQHPSQPEHNTSYYNHSVVC